MDMNWVDWAQVLNVMVWTVVLHAVAKVMAIKNRIACIQEISTHIQGAHYSLSLIQTIHLSFNMYRGWFNVNICINYSIVYISNWMCVHCSYFFIIREKTVFQILWTAFGNFNVATRCANSIPRLSTSWVVVHVIFAFTANGRLLYM